MTRRIAALTLWALACLGWPGHDAAAQEAPEPDKLPITPVIFYEGEGDVAEMFPRVDNQRGIETFIADNEELVAALLSLRPGGAGRHSRQRREHFHKWCGHYVRLLFYGALSQRLRHDEEREAAFLRATLKVADTAAESHDLMGVYLGCACANIMRDFFSGQSMGSPTVVFSPAACARLIPDFLAHERECAQTWRQCLQGESEIDPSKVNFSAFVPKDKLFALDFAAMARDYLRLCGDIAKGFPDHDEREWAAWQKRADELNQPLTHPFINPQHFRDLYHRQLAIWRCLRGFCEAMKHYAEKQVLPETLALEPVAGKPVRYQRLSPKKGVLSWDDQRIPFELP